MWLWVLLVIVATVIGLAVAAPIVLRRWKQNETTRALRLFKLRREMLEAKFFELASQLGKPRGLRWTQCDWKDEVRFARDVQAGLLTAFVGVEIHFEAIEGGDMEDVEAVGHFREASAVFHYQNGAWGTGGKALFNMLPAETVSRLEGQYTPVT